VTHVARLSVWLPMQRVKKREQRDSHEEEESLRRTEKGTRKNGDGNIQTTTTAEPLCTFSNCRISYLQLNP